MQIFQDIYFLKKLLYMIFYKNKKLLNLQSLNIQILNNEKMLEFQLEIEQIKKQV